MHKSTWIILFIILFEQSVVNSMVNGKNETRRRIEVIFQLDISIKLRESSSSSIRRSIKCYNSDFFCQAHCDSRLK